MENNEVKFNEPEYYVPKRRVKHDLFVNFLIEKGLAKNEKQAMYILFAIIIISIIISIFSFRGKTITPPKNIPLSNIEQSN